MAQLAAREAEWRLRAAAVLRAWGDRAKMALAELGLAGSAGALVQTITIENNKLLFGTPHALTIATHPVFPARRRTRNAAMIDATGRRPRDFQTNNSIEDTTMADAFLKIGDVKGECKDFEYKEWIEVLSWSWGAHQLGTAGHGTGLGASKVSMNDFSYTMHFCGASPELLLSCCSGHHYPQATLVMRKPTGKDGGQKKFLEFTFKDVIVSSYQTGGAGEDLPIESLSLNFTSMQQEYFTQDEKGVTKSAGKSGWSVKENKKL